MSNLEEITNGALWSCTVGEKRRRTCFFGTAAGDSNFASHYVRGWEYIS
jgi:hypothetical protein